MLAILRTRSLCSAMWLVLAFVWLPDSAAAQSAAGMRGVVPAVNRTQQPSQAGSAVRPSLHTVRVASATQSSSGAVQSAEHAGSGPVNGSAVNAVTDQCD